MRKLITCAVTGAILLAMLGCVFLPSAVFSEDRDTVLLAKTIYALGKNESYKTKLALGAVVMNRVDSGWFANDLGGVLRDQQQFPAGTRYDSESLRAAHDVLSGSRVIDASALYYQSSDASDPWGAENRVARVGSYSFYSESGNHI